MNKEKKLLQAAQEGNRALVQELLLSGVSVNTQIVDGDTALIVASRHGHTAIVSLLLDNGCDVDMQNKLGITPLGAACFNGFVEIVRLLIDNGAKIDHQAFDGNTPLMAAIMAGMRNGLHVSAAYYEIIVMLLERESNLDVQNALQFSALNLSITFNNIPITKLLIENGADCSVLLLQALYMGIHADDIKFIKFLFEKFSPLDITLVNKLLIAVAKRGSLEIAQFLIEQGADAHFLSDECLTAMTMAYYHYNTEIIELLLQSDKHKKNSNALLLKHLLEHDTTENKQILLDKALARGQNELFTYIIKDLGKS